MNDTPRVPGTVKSILTASLIVGGVGLVWLLVVTTGAVEIPACSDGSCGFVVAALGVGALVFLVVAAVATVAVVKVGRVVGEAVELRRYGRWLSLSERSGPTSTTDAEVQVQYHDATGGPLGGVEIAYIVGGRDPVEPVSWRSTTVTDFSGIAVIPVHVRAAPAIVTVRASVPSNPAVKRTAGVFLIGVGSGRS